MFDMNVQCFYAVAESKSFSRAAEMLFLTQPSVSRNIKVLEAELGYTLFERTTRSVRMTMQGEMLFDVLKKALKVWQTGLQEVLAAGKGLYGRLRIGLLNGWTIARLPVIDTFQQLYPNIQIEIHKFRYLELVEMLLSGSLDLIFITIAEADFEQYLTTRDPRIDSVNIFRAPLLICVSSGHPAAQQASSIQDLGEMDLFVLSQEHHPTAYQINSTLVRDRKWDLTLTPYPNIETIITAIDRHQGCTLSPAMYLSLDYQERYKAFPTGFAMNTLCAWNRENDNRKIVELFVRELQATPAEKIAIVD